MSGKYFEHEELLSPPVKRAAYSDRTDSSLRKTKTPHKRARVI